MGEWDTPITSELITSQSISLGAPVIAPDGHILWLEGRPTEGGRQVLVRRQVGPLLAQLMLLALHTTTCH